MTNTANDDAHSTTPRARPRSNRLLAALLLSMPAAWVVVALAASPANNAERFDAAVALWLGALIAAGIAFVALCPLLNRTLSPRALLAIGTAGLAMRALACTHAPVFEDDYHRYLLDGATTAHAVDPFAISPEDLIEGDADQQRLDLVASETAQHHLNSINHPHLRTIYPPTAQAAFAAAHAITPWSVTGLRVVFLAADIAALLAVVATLRTLGLPLALAGIYWLNPIVINQIIAQAHMDALVYAPLALAVAARIAGRPFTAASLLALAIGAKLWPIIAIPILFSPWTRGMRPRAALAAVATTLGLSVLVLVPAASAFGSNSGVEAYTAGWRNNALLFPIAELALEHLFNAVAFHELTPNAAARMLAAAAVGVFALAMARPGLHADIPRRLLYAAAVLFLVSPTQFPWYFTWLAPMLPFAARSGLRLSAALLPLYHVGYLSPWLPAAQHAPPLLAAAINRIRGRTP